jgi:hypothetical protein
MVQNDVTDRRVWVLVLRIMVLFDDDDAINDDTLDGTNAAVL